MGLRTVFRRASVAPSTPTGAEAGAQALLAALPGEWLMFDAHTRVIASSPGAASLGVLSGDELTSLGIAHLVAQSMADAQPRSEEMVVGGIEFGAPPRRVRARTVRLPGDRVVAIVDDISAASRVDAMRRDFIANVSNELRAPVEAIADLADRMRDAVGDEPALVGLGARMESEANQLSALVSDLTDLSRLQATDSLDHAQGVMVERLVDEAVDSVGSLARSRGVTIDRQVPSMHCIVNPEQVVTALRNLLTNAIVYSGRGAKVSVAARLHDGFVEISVADEGIGIPADQLERIFERFHRVDAERSRHTGGTGLGLAIVQQICLAHGGTVSVESEVGKGSLFTMRFPARGHAHASSADEWKEVP